MPATLSVQWDQANHQFIFGFGATTLNAPYTVSDTAASPNMFKNMVVQNAVANCMTSAGGRPRGTIDATFDDVFVNASAATLLGTGAPQRTRSEPGNNR